MGHLTLAKVRNAHACHVALTRRAAQSGTYPVSLGLETSAVCNLACNKCPVGRERQVARNCQFMDMGLYRRIIDEVKSHVVNVTLSHFGEPLINPRFLEYVRYANDRGLFTNFYSNGVALNDSAIEGLAADPVASVAFSVDCLPEQHRFYAHMKNIPEAEAREHLERVISNIERLSRRLRQARRATTLYAVRMDAPESTPEEEFRAFWRARNVTPVSGGVTDWGGTVTRVQVTRKRAASWVAACAMLYALSVHSDGKVPLCCVDYNAQVLLGDANSQTIREIYNGPVLQEMRRRVAAGDVAELPCARCRFEDFLAPRKSALACTAGLILRCGAPRLASVLGRLTARCRGR